jgi:uncharacterized protein (TIGR03435 family)
MTVRQVLLIAIAVAGTAALAAQLEPSFDVVSIRRNVSSDQSINIGSRGSSAFNGINITMLGVVMRAYGVKSVVNAPAWLAGERYDIVTRTIGQPSADRVDEMLRTMLKQRLKLEAHIEPRETSVYALVVARPNHPGLKRFTGDCDAIRAERESAMKTGQPPPQSSTSGPPCGYTWSSAIYSGGITLTQLAGMLDWVAGRVIVDRTGLPGRYEFTLRFASPTAPPSDAADAPPVLFTALHEQLGLRLDAARAPVDTLVIDHIERPTPD